MSLGKRTEPPTPPRTFRKPRVHPCDINKWPSLHIASDLQSATHTDTQHLVLPRRTPVIATETADWRSAQNSRWRSFLSKRHALSRHICKLISFMPMRQYRLFSFRFSRNLRTCNSILWNLLYRIVTKPNNKLENNTDRHYWTSLTMLWLAVRVFSRNSGFHDNFWVKFLYRSPLKSVYGIASYTTSRTGGQTDVVHT